MEELPLGPRLGDAFGAALLDALAGGPGTHVIERDDGSIDVNDATVYLLEPDAWSDA